MIERQMYIQNFAQIPKSVVSDKDGKFSIPGIGGQPRCSSDVEIQGPTIGSDQFTVVTQADTGIKLDNTLARQVRAEYRTYPATFDHIVNPVRVLEGTLRDSVTRNPIEGVQVAAWGPAYVDCFTDKQGHYKLVGLSKGKDYRISIWPFNSQTKRLPYLNASLLIRDTAGLEPITTDVNLVHGVVLRGQLTDKTTGKPAGPAEVWYATFKDNPHVASFTFIGNPKVRRWERILGCAILGANEIPHRTQWSFRNGSASRPVCIGRAHGERQLRPGQPARSRERARFLGGQDGASHRALDQGIPGGEIDRSPGKCDGDQNRVER